VIEDAASRRYLGQGYRERNPSWDAEDSPWKAALVRELLARHGLRPAIVAEVGCGAGGVLAALRPALPDAELLGFDIAPGAADFWPAHATQRIAFTLGDFFALSERHYDVLLLLDVLEHLGDPLSFLERAREHADHFVFHFPLDLSAVSVLRETPLLHVREKVGHLHYFTRGLALALLREGGYEVIEARYTGAAFNAPQRSLTTRLAGLARRLAYAVGRDFSARLLGGETLLVLARPALGAGPPVREASQ
jgi:SAM-dependent methyltransferase